MKRTVREKYVSREAQSFEQRIEGRILTRVIAAGFNRKSVPGRDGKRVAVDLSVIRGNRAQSERGSVPEA